jgi:hypothetical protein
MVSYFRVNSTLFRFRDVRTVRHDRRYRREVLQRYCSIALLFLVLLTLSIRCYAALEVHVDRNPVPLDESFTLTVETDIDTSDEPDFSILENDFDVLGQSSSTSFQFINGQTNRSKKWIVTLMPRNVGKVQIPAFTLSGQSSQPLTVSVTGARQPQAAKQGAEVFLQVDAEPKQAYVQQQVIYTLRLYRNVDLASGSQLSEPQAGDSDAIIKRLGKDSEFQTTVNGVPYAVIERKYVIFPQKSGQLTIPPVVFNGEIVDQQRGQRFMLSPFNQSIRHKRVRSGAVKLDIKAIPAGTSVPTWLPATQLQLQEEWSKTPLKFTVGEPVTWTVAILADGLTAAQLPDLSISLPDGIKSYPDQPVLKDTIDTTGITGLRQQKIALIPTRPGSFVLPEIRLPWWNTQSGKLEIASLPQRRIEVEGSAQMPPQSAPPMSTTSGDQAGTPAATESPQHVDSTAPAAHAGWWPIVALALGCAWIVTLLAWGYQRHRNGRRNGPSAVVNFNRQLAQSEQNVKKACYASDAAAARTALLDWARWRWPDTAPVSLTAMAKRCSPALAEALAILDRALYAEGSGTWQGNDLWQVFCSEKPDVPAAAGSQTTGLEPLNRH